MENREIQVKVEVMLYKYGIHKNNTILRRLNASGQTYGLWNIKIFLKDQLLCEINQMFYFIVRKTN